MIYFSAGNIFCYSMLRCQAQLSIFCITGTKMHTILKTQATCCYDINLSDLLSKAHTMKSTHVIQALNTSEQS